MSIEKIIEDAIERKLNNFLGDLDEFKRIMYIVIDKAERPMTIREASEFLGVTRATFHKYRDHVKDVGTPGSPRFLPSDLLKLKENFRYKKVA